MSQDNYIKIIESLAELKGTTSVIKDDLALIKEDTRRNTKDLETHILGVQTAQARLTTEIETRDFLLKSHEDKTQNQYKTIDARLQIVEFLPNLGRSLWKVLKWLGAMSAAIIAITKFMGLW